RLYLDPGDPHRAGDLPQETWLRAYRALRSLNSPGKSRPWMLTLAQNVLTDDARGASRQKRASPTRAGPGALASQPGPGPPPEEEAARAELRGKVLAVLRSLPVYD